jgi:ATP-dependent RNA helicase DDX49/DBP8
VKLALATMSTLFGTSKRKRTRSEGPEYDEPKKQGIGGNGDAAAESQTSTKLKPAEALSPWASFGDLGLDESLMTKCQSLGFKRPTPVQRSVIPFLLSHEEAHILALSKTGSGKTAAFVLPILQRLALDPYGIYAVVLTPTRELAKQIHQQVLALGSAYNVTSALVIGGLDQVAQSLALDARPHFCVATPGRLAELLRGPCPPRLELLRFLVLDEADRLLAANSGFERDVAELLLHCNSTKKRVNSLCQTLLFSATMTRSLESIENMAGGGNGRLPLQKFVIRDDGEQNSNKRIKKEEKIKDEEADQRKSGSDDADSDEDVDSDELTPKIPEGLTQEYIFMPSRVRDAYLLTAIRKLMINGGRPGSKEALHPRKKGRKEYKKKDSTWEDDNDDNLQKARLAIVFVSTCERAALVSCILDEVGVSNVALHSLISQNRRLAALGKFKSEQVRVLVATDVASRGLDIPTVDLVLNSELPRNTTNYIHRVGRTARAGRRGLAISLVGESDVALVHAAERLSGRPLEKCTSVTDEEAIKMLGPVTKAARLAKMKLADIGFDDLVQKFKERKVRDRKDRARIERALRRQTAAAAAEHGKTET